MGRYFTSVSKYGLTAEEEQNLLNNILRQSNDGIGRWIAPNEVIENRKVDALKGLAIGTGLGSLLGIPSRSWKTAVLGAVGGGFWGEMIGIAKADHRYLKSQGITLDNYSGRIGHMTLEAQQKYLGKVVNKDG